MLHSCTVCMWTVATCLAHVRDSIMRIQGYLPKVVGGRQTGIFAIFLVTLANALC